MASTNKTAHLSLNLWEPGDQVLRADFNADNSKLDEALFKQRPVTGVYTGNSSGAVGQEISLGFTPSIVVVTTRQTVSRDISSAWISIATSGAPAYHVWTTANGFYADSEFNMVTAISNPYRYIAWR